MAHRPTKRAAANAVYWSDRANRHDKAGRGDADAFRNAGPRSNYGTPQPSAPPPAMERQTNDPGMSGRINAPAAPGSDVGSLTAGASRGASMVATFGGMAAKAIGHINVGTALKTAGAVGFKAVALPLTAGVAAGWAAKTGYDAYQDGKSTGDIAKEAAWAAADSITLGIASMAYKQGSDAYAAMWGPAAKTVAAQAAPAPDDDKDFAEANQKFKRDQASTATPLVKSERKRGWGPEARVAAAKARGINLPYNGDPTQAPDFEPTLKEQKF